MNMVDVNQQMRLINQALAAAGASIELSRKLLAELPGGQALSSPKPSFASSRPSNRVGQDSSNLREVPGVIGVFDGENLVTEGGQKYKVPENYASKTGVVFGDKLKMIDSSTQPGGKLFKQIERVKRQRIEGILSRSDKGWSLTTPDGSYKVLEAAVKHFGGEVGTEMFGLLPRERKDVSFAALEGRVKPLPRAEAPAAPKATANEEKKAETSAEKVTTAKEKGKKPAVAEAKPAAAELKKGEAKTTKKGEPEKPAPKEKEKVAEEKKPTASSEPLIGDDELR